MKTDLGKVENPTNVPIKYIAAAPGVLCYPGGGELAQRVYDWEKAALAKSVADPGNGLRSETWSSKKGGVHQAARRCPRRHRLRPPALSDWDGLVKEWKAAGGDRSAEEFATEHAAAN